MNNYLSFFVVVLLYIVSHPALAADIYTGYDASFNRVTINNTEYTSIAPKLKLGYEISNYAAEIHYGGAGDEDLVGSKSIAVDEMLGLYFRVNFDISNDAKMFLNFGAARTNIFTTVGANTSITEYDDYSYSFGIEDYFPGVRFLRITLEYTELFKGPEGDIESINLGVRYTLQ